MGKKAEIFVLNYNGADILKECLPSILKAAQDLPEPIPVTVIDNCSRDNSREVVETQFKGVRFYLAKSNRVLCSFNEAVEQTDAEIVFLLNNDLKTESDFLTPLLKVFEDHPDAFLVAPKAFTFDKSQYEGSLSKMIFRKGLFRIESRFPGYESRVDRPSYTMQAGFGAYKRKTFLELGGFDDLYLPGTVEDTDICFQAWRKGYACYYEPKSVLYHKGQATFKRTFGQSRILAMNQRNLYLFIWKNIDDVGIFLFHLLWLLPRPLLFLLKGRIEFIWGFFSAFPRLGAAIARRWRRRLAKPVRSDIEILRISESL